LAAKMGEAMEHNGVDLSYAGLAAESVECSIGKIPQIPVRTGEVASTGVYAKAARHQRLVELSPTDWGGTQAAETPLFVVIPDLS